VNWAYWRNDQIFNENQSVEKSDFAMVDCDLTPNLIYWDEKHLNFGKNFVLDWIDKSYKNSEIFLSDEDSFLKKIKLFSLKVT
jgi:hypothetical protein